MPRGHRYVVPPVCEHVNRKRSNQTGIKLGWRAVVPIMLYGQGLSKRGVVVSQTPVCRSADCRWALTVFVVARRCATRVKRLFCFGGGGGVHRAEGRRLSPRATHPIGVCRPPSASCRLVLSSLVQPSFV